MARPRCFIAMAFDHGDTAALFERSIRPLLRRNGVEPIIVNRSESNDDLNNQIIGALEQADLCIADLTYARPSVYFEAGYAQRQVPVIYTVRRDHLHRNQPDDQRVHFDLQMKPLLLWAGPRDAKFQKRLEGRLKRSFLNAWNRARTADIALATSRQEFSGRSLAMRLKEAHSLALRALWKLGFREWEQPGRGGGPIRSFDAATVSLGTLYTIASVRGRRFVVVLRVVESATVATLREFAFDAAWLGMLGDAGRSHADTSPVNVYLLCVSLRGVPALRLQAAFSAYSQGDVPGRLTSTYVLNGAKDRAVTVHRTFDCVSPVRSLPELQAHIKQALSIITGG